MFGTLACAPAALSAYAEPAARVDGIAAGGGGGTIRATRAEIIDSGRVPAGTRAEVAELGFEWWTSRGRTDFGLGVGTVSYTLRPSATSASLPANDPIAIGVGSGSILTLGVRYYATARSVVFANASGVQGVSGLLGEHPVIGKFGLEFKAARSQWNIAYGGLGLRLNGDTRMSLRVRRGGMKVSMRTSF